jgi:hypothetical protein
LAVYAQYTFASFYGRFIQASELHLMAGNSAREFWQSISLYFNFYAVAATVISVIGYVYVIWHLSCRPASRPIGACLARKRALIRLHGWSCTPG